LIGSEKKGNNKKTLAGKKKQTQIRVKENQKRKFFEGGEGKTAQGGFNLRWVWAGIIKEEDGEEFGWESGGKSR